LKPLLERYALRYFISAGEQSALIEQTLYALAGNPQIAFETPVEKAVARVMNKILTSTFSSPSN